MITASFGSSGTRLDLADFTNIMEAAGSSSVDTFKVSTIVEGQFYNSYITLNKAQADLVTGIESGTYYHRFAGSTAYNSFFYRGFGDASLPAPRYPAVELSIRGPQQTPFLDFLL